MSRTLRGVAVGAGYFSQFQYEAWNRIPEARIVGAYNRSRDKIESIQSQYGVPNIYSGDELDRMLDEQQPDFIDVITPPVTHLEICQKAFDRGIDVICQKPLAPTYQESLQLVKNASKSSSRFMVHENWRWQPWYREIKRQIDSGRLGELFSIYVKMRMGDGWGEDAYLERQPFFRDYPQLLMFETGVHFLDAFRFLGGEIATVYARLNRRNPVIKGEDAGLVVCGFENGATATLDANRYNEADTDNARYTFGTIRIDGSKGHIDLDLDGKLSFKPLGQSAQEIDYQPSKEGFAGDCVYALQRHFVDCILSGDPFEGTGQDYLKTIQLVEASYQSNQQGRVVDLSKHA